MSASFSNWMHDDITWCSETDCPMRSCQRNQANMISRVGVHSFAVFRGTAECPVSRSLDECFDGCLHAKELFAKHDDPDEAMRVLTDLYCDDCIFSEGAED